MDRQMDKIRIKLRNLFELAEKHRVASSLGVIAFVHLAIIFLWPAVVVGQARLTPPAQVVHLTELNVAMPQPVVKTEELKVDDKKLDIGKKEKPKDKTQKSTPTSSGENYQPYFVADSQPRPLINIESVMTYPEQARRMNIQMTVVVELDIGTDGKVHRAVIVRKGGWGFDEEVLRKIKMVRFRPALKDKRPIAVTVQIPVAFRLR